MATTKWYTELPIQHASSCMSSIVLLISPRYIKIITLNFWSLKSFEDDQGSKCLSLFEAVCSLEGHLNWEGWDFMFCLLLFWLLGGVSRLPRCEIENSRPPGVDYRPPAWNLIYSTNTIITEKIIGENGSTYHVLWSGIRV